MGSTLRLNVEPMIAFTVSIRIMIPDIDQLRSSNFFFQKSLQSGPEIATFFLPHTQQNIETESHPVRQWNAGRMRLRTKFDSTETRWTMVGNLSLVTIVNGDL